MITQTTLHEQNRNAKVPLIHTSNGLFVISKANNEQMEWIYQSDHINDETKYNNIKLKCQWGENKHTLV